MEAENQAAGEETKAPAAAPSSRSGWQREYETLYLLPPDESDEASDKLGERLRAAVAREGGRVIKFTNWGRRKTAFDVHHQSRALYIQMTYLGDGKVVSEVERNLRNSEEVAKFLTTLVKKMVDPASRPTEADVKLSGDEERAAAAAARPERPDAVGEGIEALGDDLGDEVDAGPDAAD
jgi:small subunit ribosomal protein S6